MPDQRELTRQAHAIDNPFDEGPRRISAYTATEIATLQARLDKQLGPEYISKRQGQGGGQVHYIAGEKVINLANEVFGFNGWSSSIQQVQVDFVDENPNSGKVDLGLSVIVRVTLRDGMYHEDIGYGRIENCKGKGIAFEKAKKEGATDGLKRALRNFGKVLGNCLYDKEYLSKVSKIKVPPGRWDESNLHRHPDHAPLKKEGEAEAMRAEKRRMLSDRSAVSLNTERSTEYGEDEFGGNLFEEMDFTHPDEVRLDNSTGEDDSTLQTPRRPIERAQSASDVQRSTSRPPGPQHAQSMRPPPQNMQNGQRPQPNGQSNGQRPPPNPQQNVQKPGGQSGPNAAAQKTPGPATTNGAAPKLPAEIDLNNLPAPGAGFVAGRAVHEQTDRPFNPHAESPSIRRTAGIDMTKSGAVKRQDIGLPPAPEPKTMLAEKAGISGATRSNFVNPAGDPMRRVGMPTAPQSPMANRGAFKAPTAIKRPAPTETARPPLTETTNVPARVDGPGDPKKLKTDPPPQPPQAETAKA
ncbi:hypothetical protein BDZ85DRAFT_1756 [Elsinoe ampelina]|uniref:RAD52 homolog n=1 Tax=Elsinoe ampelina TaxID=302913 RepID=A0A6A6GNL8_9PEZI|nr:hypothetical protein BDZ85DRAFT_1756 [Elsinoe ampelina]